MAGAPATLNPLAQGRPSTPQKVTQQAVTPAYPLGSPDQNARKSTWLDHVFEDTERTPQAGQSS
jgi:hypothetical protein